MKFESEYIIPENFPSELLARRASLEPLLIPDFAWSRTDAIQVCSLLCDAGFAVLGGDVYEITENGARVILDNWHCDPTEEEERSKGAWDNYVLKTSEASKKYISAYHENPGRQFVYGIVWTSWKP